MVDQKQKIVEQEMLPRMAEIEQLQELVVGGETIIEDDVIATISGVAAREIEGVSSLGTSSIRRTISERVGSAQPKARGVAVEAGKRETILDIDLKVIYEFSVPDLVVNVHTKRGSPDSGTVWDGEQRGQYLRRRHRVPR